MITEDRYKNLIQVVNDARILYLQGADTGISDALYDSYLADIWEYETANPQAENSPTRSVNPDDNGDVHHPVPMLSLRDVFTVEEAKKFVEQYGDQTTISQEYKIDGLSVQLIYRDGKLVSASTRGNGYVGVECLEAARYISDIPQTLPVSRQVIVHGEVFMKKSNFEKYCTRYGKQANPRNTAVGIFKRKKELDRAIYLSFLAFNFDFGLDAIYESTTTMFVDHRKIMEIQPTDHRKAMDLLKEWNFHIVPFWVVTRDSSEDVEKVIQETMQKREDLDIPIDGMVLKFNSLPCREEVGDNGVIPNWAIAYKFPAKELETELIGIEYQVGSTGI